MAVVQKMSIDEISRGPRASGGYDRSASEGLSRTRDQRSMQERTASDRDFYKAATSKPASKPAPRRSNVGSMTAAQQQSKFGRSAGESYEAWVDRLGGLDNIPFNTYVSGVRSGDVDAILADEAARKKIMWGSWGEVRRRGGTPRGEPPSWSDYNKKDIQRVAGYSSDILDVNPTSGEEGRDRYLYLRRLVEMEGSKPYMGKDAFAKRYGEAPRAAGPATAAASVPSTPRRQSRYSRMNRAAQDLIIERLTNRDNTSHLYNPFAGIQRPEYSNPFEAAGVQASPHNQMLRAMLMQQMGYNPGPSKWINVGRPF